MYQLSRKTVLFGVLVGLLLTMSPVASAEIVVQNPSFEDYAGSDPANADIWNDAGYPKQQARSDEQARTGSFSLKIFTNADGEASVGIRQDVLGVTAEDIGKPFEFSLYVYNPSVGGLDGATFGVNLFPRDGNNGNAVLARYESARVNSTSPTDEWIKLSVENETVPTNTTYFLIEMYFSGANSTVAQSLYIDDVSLSIVPEPSSFALMALGIIGLVFCAMRRRRR